MWDTESDSQVKLILDGGCQLTNNMGFKYFFHASGDLIFFKLSWSEFDADFVFRSLFCLDSEAEVLQHLGDKIEVFIGPSPTRLGPQSPDSSAISYLTIKYSIILLKWYSSPRAVHN